MSATAATSPGSSQPVPLPGGSPFEPVAAPPPNGVGEGAGDDPLPGDPTAVMGGELPGSVDGGAVSGGPELGADGAAPGLSPPGFADGRGVGVDEPPGDPPGTAGGFEIQ
jgi:hypothetical protein